MTRYWLRPAGKKDYREVEKAEYVRAERANGFRNALGQPDEPATASFHGVYGEGTTMEPTGRRSVEGFDPDHFYYNWYGEPIEREDYVRLKEDQQFSILAESEIEGRLLRTMWLGMVIPDIVNARLFGSGILVDGKAEQVEVYDSEELALRGHYAHAAAMTSGKHCGRCANNQLHMI